MGALQGARQVLADERFGQHGQVSGGGAEGFVAVAAHQQDTHVGTNVANGERQLATIHATGHDDVADNETDVGNLPHHIQRLCAAFCFDDRVAKVDQLLAYDAPDAFVVLDQQIDTDGIILTEAAALKVKDLVSQQPEEGLVLRISVAPGGCSGLRYQLTLDDTQLEGDIASESYGVKVVTDPMSAPYLAGATIDFMDTIQQQGFTIDNPNAAGSCACGDSFH